MLKRTLSLVMLLALVLALSPLVHAEGASEDVEAVLTISGTGYSGFGFLTDDDIATYRGSNGSCRLTVESDRPITALYILFDLEYGEYTVTDNESGKSITAGSHNFLHEYVPLPGQTRSVTLDFASGKVRLSEIRGFAEGELPEDVQVWQPPLEGETELMLMPTHSDDDQLYFAGVLPLYAVEKGYKVQVVYLTDHRNSTTLRAHEMINGLWAVGITAYPVMGSFPDFRYDDLEVTYSTYASMGYSKDELLDFVVTQLRRFKPQVVVAHDFEGEYGHGMHLVYADLIAQALEITNDPNAYPDSAAAYGTWDVCKAYFHLYAENPIVLDLDTPLESFDGLTAFQVAQKRGFPCHVSQHVHRGFMNWLYGINRDQTLATEIDDYNPAHYGLYRSTVGEDTLKNDFMENTPSLLERERLAQEELDRIENERLEAERREQERLEAERLEAERQQEAEKAAEESKLADAQQKLLEEQRQAQLKKEKEEDRKRMALTITALGLVAVCAGIGLFFTRNLTGKRKDK